MNNSFWLIFLWKAIGTEADPGIFDWGVQTLVQKGLLNFFVANYFSQRLPRVAQSVNTRRRWRGKYCFASRGEQISQLKSHLRSCRCKNFSLKQASGWIGGWSGLPGPSPWIRHCDIVWTPIQAICDSPPWRSARRSLALLQKPRQNLTFLRCELKPYPVWFSCRRQSYPVTSGIVWR